MSIADPTWGAAPYPVGIRAHVAHAFRFASPRLAQRLLRFVHFDYSELVVFCQRTNCCLILLCCRFILLSCVFFTENKQYNGIGIRFWEGGGLLKIEVREGCADVEVIINCPTATDEILLMVSLLQSSQQRMPCTKDGTTYFIDKHDALYFESVDKHCFLYTASEVYETPLRLYELEDLLKDDGFIRTSKSQILNMIKIGSLCPDFGGRVEAVLENGEKLIVSRQYARQLKERLGLK
jgi:hypothetical protein